MVETSIEELVAKWSAVLEKENQEPNDIVVARILESKETKPRLTIVKE